jgi:hypothetical protein
MAPHRFHRRSAEKGVPVGTKTITMYVSDLDQSDIPAGKVYQLSIRHPDGATQQLDISEKKYRALKLQSVGKTLKKRGRKPGPPTRRPSRGRAVRARTANGRLRPDRDRWHSPRAPDSPADAKLSHEQCRLR